MPPIPSLSQAFSALGKATPQYGTGTSPYSTLNGPVQPVAPTAGSPAIPNIFGSIGSFLSGAYNKGSQLLSQSTPRVGVSSPSTLGMPAVPSLATNAPNATSAVTKQPIYIPPTPSQAPNATSVVTKQPVYGPSAPAIPNATSVVTKQPVYGPSAPAVPQQTTQAVTTTQPAATFAAPVTGNSGATFDPNTGAMVSSGAPVQPNNPATANVGNAPSASDYSTSAGGSPGAVTANGSEGISSMGDLLKKYLESLNMSPAEVEAQTKLNALNTSASQAYTDTQGQPIALPFITGQMAALQRSQTQLAQPLESSLALAQARRTARSEGLSKILDFTKPVSTSYGGTMSRLNPATGQYETVVNPFGSASGGGTNATDVIGKALSEGRISADQVTRYGIPFIAATLEKDPGYNFITQKASVASDSASLKTQQAYEDSTSRAFNTANANLTQLVQYMGTAGVNAGSTVPIINELQNKMKAGLTDPGTIAAYQAALAGLRAEYAQVLSRGGEVTEGQRAQANSLIPDNLTAAQLQQVTDRLKVEGNNAITEAHAKVVEIQKRIGSNPGGSSSSSSNSSSDVGTSWANL